MACSGSCGDCHGCKSIDFEALLKELEEKRKGKPNSSRAAVDKNKFTILGEGVCNVTVFMDEYLDKDKCANIEAFMHYDDAYIDGPIEKGENDSFWICLRTPGFTAAWIKLENDSKTIDKVVLMNVKHKDTDRPVPPDLWKYRAELTEDLLYETFHGKELVFIDRSLNEDK